MFTRGTTAGLAVYTTSPCDNLLVRVTVKRNGDAIVEPVGLHCKERSKEELAKEGYNF